MSGWFTENMAISAERARELMRDRVGDLPPGDHADVWPIGSGGILLLSNCVDANGMPYAGTATLIGPDERVWVLSSNPSIHDLDLGVLLPEAAYGSGLERFLDPDQFSKRVAEITQRRSDDIRMFQRDLRAGSLRGHRDKHLP